MSTLVRLKPKKIHIPGDELDYVGPYGLVTVRQLPLVTFDTWHEDLRIVGPNGRRRNKITIPGTNKGAYDQWLIATKALRAAGETP